jgi:hypothetical protein
VGTNEYRGRTWTRGSRKDEREQPNGS